MKCIKILLLILALLPSLAVAQWTGGGLTPLEQCGDGVDNDSSGTFGACPAGEVNAATGTGCDKLCPGDDKDGDGFTTSGLYNVDCDDSNRGVFPGEARRCTRTSANDGWQVCKLDGQFGPCTKTTEAPFCNATGGGKCYYVNATGGSNSNDGLTPATAKANYLQFVSYYQAGDRPAGWIQLVPGDSVLFFAGTYTSSFSYNGANRMFNLESITGNIDHPIRIGAYPGETVIFSNSGTFSSGNQGAIINVKDANYVTVSGLTIQNGYGQGIKASGAAGFSAYKNIIKNIDGDDANNMGGIVLGVPSACNAVDIYLNYLFDNYDQTGTVGTGSRHILTSEGYGKIHHNSIWNTNTSTRKGTGITLSKGNTTG